jgi:hypothetical protein
MDMQCFEKSEDSNMQRALNIFENMQSLNDQVRLELKKEEKEQMSKMLLNRVTMDQPLFQVHLQQSVENTEVLVDLVNSNIDSLISELNKTKERLNQWKEEHLSVVFSLSDNFQSLESPTSIDKQFL